MMHDMTHLSPEFKDLITGLLAFDAIERPTIDDLMSHPWVSETSFKIEVLSAIDLHVIPQKFKSKKNSEIIEFSRNKQVKSVRNKKSNSHNIEVTVRIPITSKCLEMTRTELLATFSEKLAVK